MARASVGPVERLLNMLGEQRACAAVYATAFALNLALCIVLIPRIGVEGAAISTATALIVESILLFYRHQAAPRLPRLHLGPLLAPAACQTDNTPHVPHCGPWPSLWPDRAFQW